MLVAAIQHDVVWEDPQANHDRLAPRIAEAAAAGARLVVLSEMFASGFSMNTQRVAEDPLGPTVRFLAEQAAAHGAWVCGSVAVQHPGRSLPGNELVLAGPDGGLRRYVKIHPFSFAGEQLHYGAGQRTVTWDLDGVRVTPFICYDLRFADDFWTTGPETDLFVVVANWPAARRRHWQALAVARAIENQAYVVAVNRVGEGDGLVYAGDSCVVDPLGEVVVSATGTETTLLAEVDPAVVADVRSRFPFLADRAPGARR